MNFLTKSITTLGLEFDALGIRAAKVTAQRSRKKIVYLLEGLEEAAGDFSKDEALIQGMADMGRKLGIKPRDRVVSLAAGKQIYVTQLRFKYLPEQEMKNALRFEIRKNLPFESAGTVLDYQVMEGTDPEKKGRPLVSVTAVAAPVLDRLLNTLAKAGMKPWIVDVLPMAVANAFWAARDTPQVQTAHLMIHFAPDMCTVVLDGEEAPFYTRSIYFSAEEIYGKTDKPLQDSDRTTRLEGLGEEIRRSLSYYEKNFGIGRFGWVYLLGNHVQQPDLVKLVSEKSGLPLDPAPLLERIGCDAQVDAGRFDLAVTLALRGREEPS